MTDEERTRDPLDPIINHEMRYSNLKEQTYQDARSTIYLITMESFIQYYELSFRLKELGSERSVLAEYHECIPTNPDFFFLKKKTIFLHPICLCTIPFCISFAMK